MKMCILPLPIQTLQIKTPEGRVEVYPLEEVLVFKKEEFAPPAKRASVPMVPSDVTPDHLLLAFLHTFTHTHSLDSAGHTWCDPLNLTQSLPGGGERLL